MRARQIFRRRAGRGFDCQGDLRGTCIVSAECLRVREDLYHLDSYSRVLVVSIGKAGHTMVEALAQQMGESSLEGIVASSVDPPAQVRGFRYFRGGTSHAQCRIRSCGERDSQNSGGANRGVTGNFSDERRGIVDGREAHRR